MTKEEQIGRLLRPGYTYRLSNFLWNTSFTAHFCKSVQNKWRYDNLRNLNPFEVLQIDPEASIEDAKKKFRRMSIMVRASFTQFHSQVELNLLSSLVHTKNALPGSPWQEPRRQGARPGGVWRSEEGLVGEQDDTGELDVFVLVCRTVLEGKETRAACMEIVEEAKGGIILTLMI